MQSDKSWKKVQFFSSMALILVAAIWGSGFIASQLALDANMSSAAIMLGRFTVAAVVMGLFSSKIIRRTITPGHIKSGIIIGLFLFAAFYVQTLGLQHTTPANNAFITAANVVIVPFLWWGVTRQKPKKIVFPASVISLIGVGILSIDFTKGFSLNVGDLLTLASAVLFACQIVATGILARKMEVQLLVFLQFTSAAVFSLLAFLATDRDFTVFVNPPGAAAILYLGLFSTCLCYFLQTLAQKHVDSAKAATESLFGTIFSVLAGYDSFSLQMVLGGGIVFASVLLPEFYLQKIANKTNNTGLVNTQKGDET